MKYFYRALLWTLYVLWHFEKPWSSATLLKEENYVLGAVCTVISILLILSIILYMPYE